MKYRCRQKELLDAFTLASTVVGSKGARPGPQDLLLEVAKDGTQTVSATDLEMSVRTSWKSEETKVDEPGQVTIPAARAVSIVREIPEEQVSLETEQGTVLIASKGSRFKVLANPVEGYPPLPRPASAEGALAIPVDLFETMIRKTAFAAALDRVHFSLTGVLLSIEKGTVRIVGTDGRRLAVFSKKVKGLKGGDVKGIVPTKGIRLFERLVAGRKGEVSLLLEKNQLFLFAEGVEASTLLIEGTYPDYNRVIPKENEMSLEVAAADLLGGLRQAAVLAGDEAKTVKFQVAKDSLTLLGESAGAGEAKVEVPAIYAGEPMALQFNPQFFMDFLKQIDEERITIKLRNAETAALIQMGAEYLYVVMPLVTR
ncbi:MAG: DNA polymerase III subunit beta [Planctomycetes bacterium]|jgi:DNA polymerase-3 subunit beta|nr:DNA polymerase III subunit beta [Planctomycetota bacterium]